MLAYILYLLQCFLKFVPLRITWGSLLKMVIWKVCLKCRFLGPPIQILILKGAESDSSQNPELTHGGSFSIDWEALLSRYLKRKSFTSLKYVIFFLRSTLCQFYLFTYVLSKYSSSFTPLSRRYLFYFFSFKHQFVFMS